jgi:OmpA-OmpF porin, OOP family
VIESDGIDGDGDGVLGTGSPAVNSNGLVTGAGSEPLDTDADGVPDQQDLDTDNDGIPDLKEVGASDSDNNGVVDIFVDSNGDGFNDVNATAPLTLPDSDGDGTPDLRDSAASNGVVSAGLNGIGAFNVYLLGLLGVLAGLRRAKLLISSVLSMLVLFVLPGQAIAQQTEQPQAEQQQSGYQRHFYIGAGLGRSTLQPDTSGTAYTLGDDSDTGYRLYGGMDLSESFSVELSLSDLGSADLKPTGKLDYSINAVNVLYYLYNQGEMKHVGMAAYLKASLGKMDVSADIPYELKNSTQIALGAGLEYAWENGFAVRADLESFDEDASILSLGLLYRFGKQQKTEPKDSDQDGVLDQNDQCPQTPLNAPVNLEGCQLDSDKDGVVDLQDQCPQTHTGAAVDSTGCELDTDGDGVKDSQDQCPQTAQGVAVDSTGCALDSDGDGVIDTLDQCPATPAGISVDKQGCPLFNAPLTGVNFKLASAELTSSAKLVLNDAAKLLLQYPAVHIEIQAHTDSQGEKANNQKLSELRAQSVFEYLQSKGIEAKRMTPVGFGESMPLVSNKTVEGRAKNRRVEFKVIQ